MVRRSPDPAGRRRRRHGRWPSSRRPTPPGRRPTPRDSRPIAARSRPIDRSPIVDARHGAYPVAVGGAVAGERPKGPHPAGSRHRRSARRTAAPIRDPADGRARRPRLTVAAHRETDVPIYAYRCSRCDARFDLMRPFARADAPAPCPDCAGPSQRQIARFAAFSKGASGTSAVAGGATCGGCSGGSCAGCGGGAGSAGR
jgi:putative FmdB family regulatory protein